MITTIITTCTYARYYSSCWHKLIHVNTCEVIICMIIIESVDSISRDSVDMQYMKIQKKFPKSQKIKTYKRLWQYTIHLWMLSWPTRRPVARNSNKNTVAKRPKCFSFFLSSDGLTQYCVNLSRWFTDGKRMVQLVWCRNSSSCRAVFC